MKYYLYYPVRPYVINQNFGENNACIEDNSLPISKRKIVSKRRPIGTPETMNVCPANFVEFYPLIGMKGHNGLDLQAFHGQRLYHASPEGIVEEIQTEVERGLGIGIISKEKFTFKEGEYQVKIRYWHLKSINVRLGDTVQLGDMLGECDNTGASSSDHLHLEIKLVGTNLMGNYYNLNQDNGYYGAIDPKPYFIGEYAQNSGDKLFNKDLLYKTSGYEVKKLQSFLRKKGYFDYKEDTGFYGDLTREAVYRFQLDHVKMTWWEKFRMTGQICGKKTRAVINGMISNEVY